jgi:AcrR family transcriptional regulator
LTASPGDERTAVPDIPPAPAGAPGTDLAPAAAAPAATPGTDVASVDAAPATRDRIVQVAMDLFGRQGFRATTVNQIEAGAGLSVGAGGLYRHFRSKKDVLVEGLRRQAEAGRGLLGALGDPTRLAALPPRERLLVVGRAGLARLEQERDLNRLLVRDLARFPDLLEQVRTQELQAVARGLTAWLAAQPDGIPGTDWAAVAAVLMAAVSHYWIMRDVFSGQHPHGIDEDRFLGAACDLAASRFR